MQRILQEIMKKKIILGTSDAWSMSCLSQGPSIWYWRLLGLRAYCLNIYCDIYRQGRNSSILMNKTCTNDLLKVFVIHGQDNSWLTWNINAQWKNLHILFNNHKLSCTLSAALGVKTSAYFLNRKMPIKVKFKCCFVFFCLWIIWFCIYLRHTPSP